MALTPGTPKLGYLGYIWRSIISKNRTNLNKWKILLDFFCFWIQIFWYYWFFNHKNKIYCLIFSFSQKMVSKLSVNTMLHTFFSHNISPPPSKCSQNAWVLITLNWEAFFFLLFSLRSGFPHFLKLAALEIPILYDGFTQTLHGFPL